MLNKSIAREIFPEIKKHLQSKEITVIIGPKIKTFNLDLIQDHSLLKNQADLFST